jgi:hypothetical protein
VPAGARTASADRSRINSWPPAQKPDGEDGASEQPYVLSRFGRYLRVVVGVYVLLIAIWLVAEATSLCQVLGLEVGRFRSVPRRLAHSLTHNRPRAVDAVRGLV